MIICLTDILCMSLHRHLNLKRQSNISNIIFRLKHKIHILFLIETILLLSILSFADKSRIFSGEPS